MSSSRYTLPDQSASGSIGFEANGARRWNGDAGTDGLAVAWFAKIVVLATFALIFIGGLVTSYHAGMAVPDWPLSYGSLNPDGWWSQLPVRLEHGHRLFAMFVGGLVGVLCAWVWQSWRALIIAAAVMGVVPQIATTLGASPIAVMHLRIWPAAAAFILTIVLIARSQTSRYSHSVRWLALAAFIGVCFQAVLGGLRVTQETAGALDSALVLRIAHGVFAQTVLCVTVALAALLGRYGRTQIVGPSRRSARVLQAWAWLSFGAIYLQLIAGAAMRHMGAGLAIPTFPEAASDGSWLPAVHNRYVDLNFLHTRVGAIFVAMLVVITASYAIRRMKGVASLTRPAWGLLGLVLVQVVLGVLVIWHAKPRTLTTFHVLNGAALLALSILLALRSSRAVHSTRDLNPVTSS